MKGKQRKGKEGKRKGRKGEKGKEKACLRETWKIPMKCVRLAQAREKHTKQQTRWYSL
jgi:hypothetical protein